MNKFPTICLCYVSCEKDNIHLQRSLSVMLEYPWISECVVLFSDRNEKPYKKNGINYYFEYHGHGFDQSLNDGGFDQIVCRNSLLEYGRKTGAEWLLLCDSDEYYTKETEEIFYNKEKYNGIVFETYNFYDFNTIFKIPKFTKYNPFVDKILNQDAIRGVRSSISAKYHKMPKANLWKNSTRHCCIFIPIDKIFFALGLYKIHTKYISERRKECVELRDPDISFHHIAYEFPSVYKEMLNKI